MRASLSESVTQGSTFPQPVYVVGTRIAVFATASQATTESHNFDAVIVFDRFGVEIVKGENLIDVIHDHDSLRVYSRCVPGIAAFQCPGEKPPAAEATFWVILPTVELMVRGTITFQPERHGPHLWQVAVTKFLAGRPAISCDYFTGRCEQSGLAKRAILGTLQQIANTHYARRLDHPLGFMRAETQQPIDTAEIGYDVFFEGESTYVVR